MSISVVLEVLSGPERGRKVRLGTHQTVTIGRTERSDFVHASDSKMSGRHFTLETERDVCRLTDLESANGTYVNDERIETADVRDGDRIRAADTNFVVRLTGDKSGDTTTPRAMRPSMRSAPIASAAPAAKVQYVKQKCKSDLLLYRGESTQVPAVEIARRVTQLFPLWIIVDFAHLGAPSPGEVAAPQHVLDWLPAPVAERSPLVLNRQSVPDPFAIVDQGWGKGGLSCWFSRSEPAELLAHFRKISRVNDNTMLGYWSPSILGMLLNYSMPDYVKKLMVGIDAVMVEPHDQPENWLLFSYSSLDDVLKQLGFTEAPAADAAAEQSAP